MTNKNYIFLKLTETDEAVNLFACKIVHNISGIALNYFKLCYCLVLDDI